MKEKIAEIICNHIINGRACTTCKVSAVQVLDFIQKEGWLMPCKECEVERKNKLYGRNINCVCKGTGYVPVRIGG